MRRALLALAMVAGSAAPLHAEWATNPVVPPGLLCRPAVAAAERGSGIPAHLLAAISRVESGRRDPANGTVSPWPWTVNAEGQGYFYDSKAEAVAAVRAMQARGIRSIDVGCAQVNLMHHPDAFPNLDAAFDPQTNEAYAARFLKDLFAQSGDWTKAAGLYHSATPELGAEYRRQVLAAWPEEQKLAGLSGTAPLAQAWSATLPVPPAAGFTQVMRLAPAGTVTGPHVILQPAIGGMAPPGRGLDAYRAAPIGLAFQPPPRRAGG